MNPKSPSHAGDSLDGLEPDPVIEAYKKDVDRTLLRANLQRTVDERIENLMRMQRFAIELKAAGKKAR